MASPPWAAGLEPETDNQKKRRVEGNRTEKVKGVGLSEKSQAV